MPGIAAVVMAAMALTAGLSAPSAQAAEGISFPAILAGETPGISANPGAVNVITGSGLLGRLLGFDKDSGVHLGGAWVRDAGYLISGGAEPGTWSFNSLLLVELSLDLEKLL